MIGFANFGFDLVLPIYKFRFQKVSDFRKFIMPNVNFLHKSYHIINNIEDNTFYNYTFYKVHINYSRNYTLYNIYD